MTKAVTFVCFRCLVASVLPSEKRVTGNMWEMWGCGCPLYLLLCPVVFLGVLCFGLDVYSPGCVAALSACLPAKARSKLLYAADVDILFCLSVTPAFLNSQMVDIPPRQYLPFMPSNIV